MINKQELLERLRKRKAELLNKNSPESDVSAILAKVRLRKAQLLAKKPRSGTCSSNETKAQIGPGQSSDCSPKTDQPGKNAPPHSDQQQVDSARSALAEFDREYSEWLATCNPNSLHEWWHVQARVHEVSADIVHPVLLEPPWELHLDADNLSGIRVVLTPDEIKRQRRLSREQLRKDAEERVRLGLDKAPGPKLKPSNVMAAIGPEYYKDPTHYEELAKKEARLRHKKHLADNAARTLTPDERWLKKEAKALDSRRKSLTCAVLFFKSMDGKQVFVVDAEAHKGFLTGVCLRESHLDGAVVIVEGGEAEVRKFRNKVGGELKWTGPLLQAAFTKWSVHFLSNGSLWSFLRAHHVDHLFRAATW